MPSVKLAPFPRFKALDQNAGFLAGGKLFSYIAGTNTLKATYSDQTGSVPNQNPVILDGSGEADIWLSQGAYKFVLADADDVVQWSVDNIEAQPSDLVSDTLTTGAIAVSGQITSSVTGVSPFVVASLVKVANLNADRLDDADWASPGQIGSATPSTGTFSSLTASALTVGNNGSPIKQISYIGGTRVPVDLPSIAANSRGSVTASIAGGSGINVGDILIPLNTDVDLANGKLILINTDVTGLDTVKITAYNPTGSPIDTTLIYLTFLWIDLT